MKATCVLACLAIVAIPKLAVAQNDSSDLSNRGRASELVVVGTVEDVDPVFETNRFGDQLIVSKVTMRVDEAVKGAPGRSIKVSVEGGTVGDLTLDVSDMPSVKKGERAALFLDHGDDGSFVPHGRGLGILKLDASDHVLGSDLTLDDVRRAVRNGQR